MMTTIIWKGILYNSLEYCQLSESKDNILVDSKIIGTSENKIYRVDYTMAIDRVWKGFNFDISFEINNKKDNIKGVKEGSEWKIDGKATTRFSNCDFIDISLSPFTNTLSFNSLH